MDGTGQGRSLLFWRLPLDLPVLFNLFWAKYRAKSAWAADLWIHPSPIANLLSTPWFR
ncbi:hypothetical protein [Synechococcus elongatus]|nr:hypothetical protein [Synechococcus elongatus]MBD2586749.1 hypothetical protein [Synechococcus elongatus FACHB-242]MBD2706468.1 hypothetical protein [Synechococcus elongatus PCC 7942 = FACHB-805]WKW04981.1 hypothetical protein QY054_10370 [Synechococcus elongatus PCC 7942 = FACHB-805]